jgi:hypothetical protein
MGCVVWGEQIQGQNHSWESDRAHYLKKTCLRVAIRRNHFVVEESLQEVPNQKLKFTSFRRLRNWQPGLHFEGENRMFRRREDAEAAKPFFKEPPN